MSIWDHKSKKRLRQYPKYHAPVPSIAFNSDGTKLAVGVSYTWEEGEEGAKTAERPAVFIKNVGEEVKVIISFKCATTVTAGADRACSCSTAEGMDGVGWLTVLCVASPPDCARLCVVLCISPSSVYRERRVLCARHLVVC